MAAVILEQCLKSEEVGRGVKTNTSRSKQAKLRPELRGFVDLFSGCGGLSLGLSEAGWQGIFAVEKDEMAFETFSANFLSDGAHIKFDWPIWLPKQALSIQKLLRTSSQRLRQMRGKVDLLAGGPPCQGFSFSGKRRKSDPRNALFKKYIELVKLVKPKVLILENVPGMSVAHERSGRSSEAKSGGRPPTSYLEKLMLSARKAGYVIHARTLNPVEFGVPQKRMRLIVIGLRADIATALELNAEEMYDVVLKKAMQLPSVLNLAKVVTARAAISDLEIKHCALQDCVDPQSPKGFKVPKYRGPRTKFQKFLNEGVAISKMDSTRLARHSTPIVERFQRILDECRKGVRMDDKSRERYGLEKHRIYPMAPNQPSPTLTTLPDDVLHYSEPRILSVRETARLQSFPDWFVFRGKYTTGGNKRVKECPRYTQVGNAVPPLLARAIGVGVAHLLELASEASPGSTPLRNGRA